MAYRYLDDWTQADVAFEATAHSFEDLLSEAVDATLNVMVSDLRTIQPKEEREEQLTADTQVELLHEFLERILYYKDSDQLLLRASRVSVASEGSRLKLTAKLRGEKLDPHRHELVADVKAITHHRFELTKQAAEWRATAVLDV